MGATTLNRSSGIDPTGEACRKVAMTSPTKPTSLRVLQSASAATLSQVWRLALTFTTMWLIRRMMGPEELAVWQWVEPLFVLLSITRDLGVNGHLVRLEQRRYGNFMVIVVVWGGLFASATALAAPWLAQLFESHDQQTVEIIRVMALFLWIQGLGLVPMTFFEAEHLITRAIPAELARNAVFAVLAVYWVWSGQGVWGVVYAHLIGSVIFTLILWLSARRRGRAGNGMRMPVDIRLREIPALIRGSLPLAALSLLEQAVLNLDILLLGLVLREREVGEAGLAIYALFFFSRLIADAAGRAVYPAIVAYRDEPAKAFGLYRTATLFLVCCFVPMAFFLHHNAELVALFLGGTEWTGAATYITVAAFVPLVRPLTMFGREYLLAAHRDGLLLAYTLTNLVSLGGLGYCLVKFTDLQELGMAIAGYFPLGTLFLAWGLWQLAPQPFVQLIREMLLLYGIGLMCFIPLWFLPLTSQLAIAAASCVAGAVFGALAYRQHGRDLWLFVRAA